MIQVLLFIIIYDYIIKNVLISKDFIVNKIDSFNLYFHIFIYAACWFVPLVFLFNTYGLLAVIITSIFQYFLIIFIYTNSAKQMMHNNLYLANLILNSENIISSLFIYLLYYLYKSL